MQNTFKAVVLIILAGAALAAVAIFHTPGSGKCTHEWETYCSPYKVFNTGYY